MGTPQHRLTCSNEKDPGRTDAPEVLSSSRLIRSKLRHSNRFGVLRHIIGNSDDEELERLAPGIANRVDLLEPDRDPRILGE